MFPGEVGDLFLCRVVAAQLEREPQTGRKSSQTEIRLQWLEGEIAHYRYRLRLEQSLVLFVERFQGAAGGHNPREGGPGFDFGQYVPRLGDQGITCPPLT